MFLSVFEAKTTDLTMVKFVFWKVVPTNSYHQNITVTHSSIFFELLKKAHFFIALTTTEGDPLMSNCSSVFDNTTIISIFLNDKVVFEI